MKLGTFNEEWPIVITSLEEDLAELGLTEEEIGMTAELTEGLSGALGVVAGAVGKGATKAASWLAKKEKEATGRKEASRLRKKALATSKRFDKEAKAAADKKLKLPKAWAKAQKKRGLTKPPKSEVPFIPKKTMSYQLNKPDSRFDRPVADSKPSAGPTPRADALRRARASASATKTGPKPDLPSKKAEPLKRSASSIRGAPAKILRRAVAKQELSSSLDPISRIRRNYGLAEG